MTSSSTSSLTPAAKRKYHLASSSVDPIPSGVKWMKKTAGQTPQHRSTAGGIIIVSSTTEEELTSPEKYTIKSGSESDPPLMVSLVPSSEHSSKAWTLSPSERASSRESSDSIVMDEDLTIAEMVSSESENSSELEALIENRIDGSEDTDEFEGIQTKWIKDGESVSSIDSEDDGETSGPVQPQRSETHQKKTVSGARNQDGHEDTDEEELVLPILSLPSRRSSQTTSVYCPRNAAYSRQDCGNSERRSTQKDQERHPPKNLRKRPRETFQKSKKIPDLGGDGRDSEDSVKSCSSDDDSVASHLKSSRTLQEKIQENKAMSNSDLTSLSVTNGRTEESVEGLGMGVKVQDAFLAGHGAPIKMPTSQGQSGSNSTSLSADADEFRTPENSANECSNEKYLCMMADTQQYIMKTKILCYPLSVERGPLSTSGKVSETNSCESKDFVTTLEPDSAIGMEGSQHLLSELYDMTQPYCRPEEDAACLPPSAGQAGSEFRNNRSQGPAGNERAGHRSGASSGTGVAATRVSVHSQDRSDASDKAHAVAEEEYSEQEESQQSQLLFDSEEEMYGDHGTEVQTLSSQPKHSSAAEVSERLETSTREVKLIPPVSAAESKDLRVLATCGSGKSDTSSITEMRGDNKSSVSYSTGVTSEDDDAVMVFDSEEEELYSRFTQVEVKKESPTSEDEKINVISSEEDMRKGFIGYDGGDQSKSKQARTFSIPLAGRTPSTDEISLYKHETLVDEDVDMIGDNSVYDQQTLADDDVDMNGDRSAYDQQTLVDDYIDVSDDGDAYAAETQVEVDLVHGLHDSNVARMPSFEGAAGCLRSGSSKRHGTAPVECAQLKSTEDNCKQKKAIEKSAENSNSVVQENALDKSAENRICEANKTSVYDVQTVGEDYGGVGGGDMYMAETQIDVDLLHGLHESNPPSGAARRGSAEGPAGYAYSESSKTGGTLLPKSAQRLENAKSNKQVQETDRKNSAEDATCTNNEASVFEHQTLADDLICSDSSDDAYLAETQPDVDSMHHCDNSNVKKSLTMKVSSESSGGLIHPGSSINGATGAQLLNRPDASRPVEERYQAKSKTTQPSSTRKTSVYDQQTLVDDYIIGSDSETAYMAETQINTEMVKQMKGTPLDRSAANATCTTRKTSADDQQALAEELTGGSDEDAYLADTQLETSLVHSDSSGKKVSSRKTSSEETPGCCEVTTPTMRVTSPVKIVERTDHAHTIDNGLDNELYLAATQIDASHKEKTKPSQSKGLPVERSKVKQTAQKSVTSREQPLLLAQKSQEWLTKAKEKDISNWLKQTLSGIPGTLVKRKEGTSVNSSTICTTSKSADISHSVCSVKDVAEKEFTCDVQTRDTQHIDVSKIQPASVGTQKNCLLPTSDGAAGVQIAFEKNIFDAINNTMEITATDITSDVDQIMADPDREMNSEDDSELFEATTQIDTQLVQDQQFITHLHREPFHPSSSHQENILKHTAAHENTNPDSAQPLVMGKTNKNCEDEMIVADEVCALESDASEDQDAYSIATQVDVGPRRAMSLGNKNSEERQDEMWEDAEDLQNQKDVSASASLAFRPSSSEKSGACRTSGREMSKQVNNTSDRSYEHAVRKMEEIKKRAQTSRTQEIAIQPERRHKGHWRKTNQVAAKLEAEKTDAAWAGQTASNPDERWLSSASKRHLQEEKKLSDRNRKKRGPESPSKRLKRSSGSREEISISTDAARKVMEARNRKVIIDPTSVANQWRRSTSLPETTCVDTDVELPNTQEVMEKQYPMLFPSFNIRKPEEKSRKPEEKSRKLNTNITQESENGEGVLETSKKDSHLQGTCNERSRTHFSTNSSQESEGRKTGSSSSNHSALSEKQKPAQGPRKLLNSDKNQGTTSRKENITGTIDKSSLMKVGRDCPKRSSISDFTPKDSAPNTFTSGNKSSHVQVMPERRRSMASAQERHFSKDETCKQGTSKTDPSTGRQRHTSHDSSLMNVISVSKPGILKDPFKAKETTSTKSVRINLTDSQEDKFQARASAKQTSSLATTTSRPVPSSHPQTPAAAPFGAAWSVMPKRATPAPSCMLGMTLRTSDMEAVSSVVSRAGQAATGQLLQSDELMCKVLGWSPQWLEEYEKSDNGTLNSLPPIVKRDKLFPLVTTYDNIFEYQQISFMLLLLEIWDEIFKNWKEKKARKLPICNVCYTSNLRYTQKMFLGYEWKGFLSKQQLEGRLYPAEGDVVVVEMYGESIDSKNHDPSKLKIRPQLGHVEKVTIQPRTKTKDVIKKHPALQGHHLDTSADACLMTIMLKMRYQKFAPSCNHLVKLYSLGTIVTDVRRFEALVHLPRSHLARDMLKPTPTAFIHSQRLSNRPLFQSNSGKKYVYNEIQSQAIRNLAAAVQEPPQVPRVRLLQGPPGTGKSHVIVGLILKLLEDSRNEAKICLAAPSNAAADELLLRLAKKKKEDRLNFSMVRIGTVENVRAEVRDYTLEAMIQKKKAEALKMKQLQSIPKSLQAEFERYEKLIHQKKSQILECQIRKDKQEEEKLAKQLTDLKKKHTQLQKIFNEQKDVSLTSAEYHAISRDLLLQSNIVCGTLSSFGSPRIYNIFRDNGNSSNLWHFSCAIIDEATQATELDCLIPLQYGMTKLILVGDPNQLPPTVLSQKAQMLNYGLSLFERLYNHFQEDCEKESPLLMLRMQYRMDKAICQFPNNHVYDGQLITDSQIIENCKRYPLQPYLIFDLVEGQEQLSQSGSISNEAEADFTAELCSQILKLGFKIHPSSVGIICPYSSQKKLVLRKLDARGVKQVEVNTVDGFQGREKHIIILSCVRAQSTSGSIGFMADRRRMNVALTRAKYALYIIGHLQSLMANQDWEALIRDAQSEDRSLVVPVTSLKNVQTIVRHHCVKPSLQSKIKVASPSGFPVTR